MRFRHDSWLIVAQIMSEKGKGLGELVAEMEAEFPCSGEINLPANHVNAILEAIEKKYTPDAERIDKIDGIGVDFKTGDSISARPIRNL